MVLATTPTAVTGVAEKILGDLRNGSGSRTSIDTRAAAFSWTSGMPLTLADYVTPALADGLTFPVVLVGNSATPGGPVAEAAPKPLGASFTSSTVNLSKYAGIGEFTLEGDLQAAALSNVVYQLIAGQCLRAFEADAMVELGAGASATVTATTLIDAILAAQAEVLANGGRPGVLVLSPAGYAAVAGGGQLGGYASPDPAAGPIGRLFGMGVHVSGALTSPDSAYVLDPTSVLAIQNANSPMVIVDPYSGSSTNKIKLVVDLFAATKVVSPGGVVEATKTP